MGENLGSTNVVREVEITVMTDVIRSKQLNANDNFVSADMAIAA